MSVHYHELDERHFQIVTYAYLQADDDGDYVEHWRYQVCECSAERVRFLGALLPRKRYPKSVLLPEPVVCINEQVALLVAKDDIALMLAREDKHL